MDWYFDFVSPFAYLQLERLRRDHPEVRIRPVPILLAGLFNHWGTVGPAEIEPKRRFTYRFVLWQARRWNIPLTFPPAHPFNPLAALRLAIAAGASADAVMAIFRRIWRDGVAADNAEALAPVAAQIGIADIAAALADPSVKAQLRANGEAAIADGVFGVPTLVVDGEVFWGMDATEMALDYVADPGRFLDAGMRAIDALPIGAERLR